MKEICILATFS